MDMSDILLSEFNPVSELVVPEHHLQKPKFPAIDFHVHYRLGTGVNDYELEMKELEQYGVKAVVNLDGYWGEKLDNMLKHTEKQRDRIVTFGSIDVTKLEEPDFPQYVRKTLHESYKKGIRGLKFFKSLGLLFKDSKGNYIRGDDKRLKPIWEIAAELNIPVLMHIADPIAFFKPIDSKNERFEELNRRPEWSYIKDEFFTFKELMNIQEAILFENPQTTFVMTHMGNSSEDLGFVSGQMDRYKNMYVDMAARLSDIGRQPYSSRNFIIKYQDRIMFSTDSFLKDASNRNRSRIYPYYWRCLETYDEYFDYAKTMGQGRWKIYGIGLPDEVLKKVYYENAIKLVPDFKKAIE